MARPRKNNPRPLLQPLIAEFVASLSAAVERATFDRVVGVIEGAAPKGRAVRVPRTRPATTCYYPGCKNTAAPRFGMFCAALHKNLPKAEKARLRARHDAS